MANWRKNNPEKANKAYRRDDYRKSFGIELFQYEGLLISQNGVCKICRNIETAKSNRGSVRRLAIDHCHETGKIRGLICYRCNYVLGLCKDNIQLLDRMIKYISTSDTGLRISTCKKTVEEMLKELLQE